MTKSRMTNNKLQTNAKSQSANDRNTQCDVEYRNCKTLDETGIVTVGLLAVTC